MTAEPGELRTAAGTSSFTSEHQPGTRMMSCVSTCTQIFVVCPHVPRFLFNWMWEGPMHSLAFLDQE